MSGRWFKAYPAYKDSGVEWLGEIPAEWVAKRLKFVASEPIKNGIGEAGAYDNPEWPRYVRITDIAGPRELREDTFKSLPPALAREALFSIGDLLLAAVGATFGKSYLHAQDLGPSCFAGYLVRFSPCREVEPGFAAYWTESSAYWALVQSRVVQATIQNFSAAKYKDLVLPLPSLTEQRGIAAFLDRETARIDALLAKKERLIELLQEQRTALITRAVTKGLDPTVPMKDSGVEWLGEIPADWDAMRLKFLLAAPLKYGANEAAELDDPDLPRYVRITDIDDKDGLREETFKSLSADVAEEYLLREGDLLFARSGATAGKTLLYRRSWGECAYAGYLIRARLETSRAWPDFVRYFTASSTYWQWLSAAFIQATIQNVSAERYASLMVPLPQYPQQRAIAAFLDRETVRIDALVAKVREAIDRLKELRTALISAAVTGKIDVREEVA